ncbi:PWI domain-containing protein [Sodiomyces alkalinus F11]|uniref:PWI domain-containing protein n=1 Tax=Sodiomyces alkalinus (strain CBS 110278 / VKM F-3762 / F11) TaxID=1314773 RepID=A0A3N2PK86_SODAK|nr:PWI domain-containing protein [Sodiomyces alkalinus F11]ROT34804.1 PWI domain-containing protein [Sodiomyces alkalinus F11]
MATDVDARLLKSTKFPPEFSQKVDMQQVNLHVMKKWIANKISDVLGDDDDVVIELCLNLIEGSRFPDIKSLQIQLTGFLNKQTPSFCKELWNMLLSAQSSPQGVPKELLEAKKQELIQEKIEADRLAEEARKRRQAADRTTIGRGNARDRHEQTGARARDTWRGRYRDHNNSDSYNRPSPIRHGRRSMSPVRHRERRDRDGYRDAPYFDSYKPDNRRRGQRNTNATQRENATRSRSPCGLSHAASCSPTPEARHRRCPSMTRESPASSSLSEEKESQRRSRPRTRGGRVDNSIRDSPHGSRSMSPDSYPPASKRARRSRSRS